MEYFRDLLCFDKFQAEDVQFVILVLCPSEVKMTKSALETGRTFSTLFADITLRHDLLEADTVAAFKEIIRHSSEDFAERQNRAIREEDKSGSEGSEGGGGDPNELRWYHFGKGIVQDLKNRYYNT